MVVSDTTRHRTKRVSSTESSPKKKKKVRSSSSAKKSIPTKENQNTATGKTVTPPKENESKYFVICPSMQGVAAGQKAKLFDDVAEANEYYVNLDPRFGTVLQGHATIQAANLHLETFKQVSDSIQHNFEQMLDVNRDRKLSSVKHHERVEAAAGKAETLGTSPPYSPTSPPWSPIQRRSVPSGTSPDSLELHLPDPVAKAAKPHSEIDSSFPASSFLTPVKDEPGGCAADVLPAARQVTGVSPPPLVARMVGTLHQDGSPPAGLIVEPIELVAAAVPAGNAQLRPVFDVDNNVVQVAQVPAGVIADDAIVVNRESLAEGVRARSNQAKSNRHQLIVFWWPKVVDGQSFVVVLIDFVQIQRNNEARQNWMWKPEGVADVLSDDSVNPRSPSVKALFGSLQSVPLRNIPFGANRPKKNAKKYDISAVFGFYPLSATATEKSIERELTEMGDLIKRSIPAEWFRDAYLGSIARYEGLVNLIDQSGQLWADATECSVVVSRKSSLDSHFMDVAVKEITERLFGVDAAEWNDAMKRLAYRSGEIPGSFYQG